MNIKTEYIVYKRVYLGAYSLEYRVLCQFDHIKSELELKNESMRRTVAKMSISFFMIINFVIRNNEISQHKHLFFTDLYEASDVFISIL